MLARAKQFTSIADGCSTGRKLAPGFGGGHDERWNVKPDDRFGPHARGYIMYEPDGHMCAEIMNPDRPAWKNPDKPTEEEKIAAFDGLIAYCGTYKLDA